MKTLFAILFLTSCLSSLVENVTVQDGDYEFPLEEVKELWSLMDKDHLNSIPDGDKSQISTLCKDPELPEVFQPVCASNDASQIFYRLKDLAVKADICEICAYAACSGC
ncbi:guanylin-like [Scyliorhinus canicula]|uniref:guanylin-like n=1 Tax=Scyliorhinus canicula TaxID=7830 RepID=UPI0018F4A1B7|nr:guanylin-like [Scyliorhinus canicula]